MKHKSYKKKETRKKETCKNKTCKRKKGGAAYYLGNSIASKNGESSVQSLDVLVPFKWSITPSSRPRVCIGGFLHATPFSNTEAKFKYHSYMMATIENMRNDPSMINMAIDNYLNTIVEELNNNKYGIKYDLNHIKICDFKCVESKDVLKDGTIIHSVSMNGNIYIYDASLLNKKIEKQIDKLPDSVGLHVNSFLAPSVNSTTNTK